MANLVAQTGESTGGISAPTPESAHRRRRATPTRPAVTSVIPRRSPRPGRPTGGLVQVVVVLELAAVLVVYGLYGGMIALAAVAPVALGLTVLALVRRRRRWLVEWLWIYLAYSRRQRLARDRQAEFADPGLTPLLEARPGLSTSTITDPCHGTHRMVEVDGSPSNCSVASVTDRSATSGGEPWFRVGTSSTPSSSPAAGLWRRSCRLTPWAPRRPRPGR